VHGLPGSMVQGHELRGNMRARRADNK
jgi:hypothetical protein